MKKKLLINCSFLLIFFLNAQSQNKFKQQLYYDLLIGKGQINSANSNSIQNTITYSFHRFFTTDLCLTFSNSYEGLKNRINSYDNFQSFKNFEQVWHQTLYSLGLNLYLTPLNSNKHLIGLGAGLSYNYQIDTEANINGLYSTSIMTIGNTTSNGFGIDLVVKYIYKLNPKLALGIKAYGIYFNDSCESLLISIGYKLSD